MPALNSKCSFSAIQCTIPLVFLALVAFSGNVLAQASQVSWDLSAQNFAGLLPQDEGFSIKVTSIPTSQLGKAMRLRIEDHTDYYTDTKAVARLTQRIAELEGDPTKATAVKKAKARLAARQNKLQQSWLSNVIVDAGTKSGVTHPYLILKPNSSYRLFLEVERELTSDELERLAQALSGKSVVENVLYDFLKRIANAAEDAPPSAVDNVWYNSLRKAMVGALYNIDPTYELMEFDIPTTLSIRKPLRDLFDSYAGLKKDMSAQAKDIDKYGWHKMDQDISKPLTDSGITGRLADALTDQLETFSELKNEIQRKYLTSMRVITREYVVKYEAIGNTFSSNIVDRTNAKFISTTGLALVTSDINKPTTTVGFNYHLRPLSTKVPIARVDDGSWFKNALKRISVFAAVSFVDLNGELFPSAKREGLLDNKSVIGGLGLYVTDGVYLNFGGILYNDINPNPAITQKDLRLAAFWSISTNVSLGSKLKIEKP